MTGMPTDYSSWMLAICKYPKDPHFLEFCYIWHYLWFETYHQLCLVQYDIHFLRFDLILNISFSYSYFLAKMLLICWSEAFTFQFYSSIYDYFLLLCFSYNFLDQFVIGFYSSDRIDPFLLILLPFQHVDIVIYSVELILCVDHPSTWWQTCRSSGKEIKE